MQKSVLCPHVGGALLQHYRSVKGLELQGHLTLYGNNEPWLDTRIVEFHKYARKQLPDCFIFMSTNGLILDIDKVKSIIPYVNQLIINNYCLDMKLHDNIQEIYDYVNAHPDEFKDVDILIQMRYLKEVLTNRAGSAPNKKGNQQDYQRNLPDAVYRYVDHTQRQAGYLLLR